MAHVDSPAKAPKADLVFFVQRKALFTQANKMFTSLGTQVHVSLLHNGQRYEYTTEEERLNLPSKTAEPSTAQVWTPKDFRKPALNSPISKNKTAAEMSLEAELTQIASQVRGVPAEEPGRRHDCTRGDRSSAPSPAPEIVDLTTPDHSSVQATTPPPPPRKTATQSRPQQESPDSDSPILQKQLRDNLFSQSLSSLSPDESGVVHRTSFRRIGRYTPY